MLAVWNAFAMPRCTRDVPLTRVTSRPLYLIVPEFGAIVPESRLKNVVLPAPFGPMTARSSPGSTLKVDVGVRREMAERSCRA